MERQASEIEESLLGYENDEGGTGYTPVFNPYEIPEEEEQKILLIQ